ncbi:MAG: hypothetical protein PVH88_27410 [Ignavibacteria bacterium]|jgi:hypothetical protein
MKWQDHVTSKEISSIKKLHSTYEIEYKNFSKRLIINVWEAGTGEFYGTTNLKMKRKCDGSFYTQKNSCGSPEEALQLAVWGFADVIRAPYDEIEYEEVKKF